MSEFVKATSDTGKKLLITNVVYGSLYSRIFLDQHLKSMLDPTNLPTVKDRVIYAIYTDPETKQRLLGHPNYLELEKYCKIRIYEFKFAGIENRFEKRYGILASTLQLAIEVALEENFLLMPLVADLVVAKHFMPKIFERFEAGHDSVFTLPMRSAFESVAPFLNANNGAYFADDLFEIGYQNLHPLWVACHMEAAQFSKLPYSLLWNTGSGLLAHSFSITPIAFQPTPEMQKVSTVIDIEIPGLCKNPYWAQDWTDCAVIGVEPLFCYYPPFKNQKANPETIKKWADKTCHVSQKPTLRKPLYFPNKVTVNASQELEARAAAVVDGILGTPTRIEQEID